MNMSAACSALDALDRRMVQVTPLGIQGEGCRLGEKTHRVLDCRPGADSPRRQAALPASGRRYVTVLQGEGSLRRRPPFVHRMFGIEQGLNPLPVAGAGLDQAAVLNGHLIARQADRAVDVADGTGPASSRTPYPTAEQAGPQMLRAPVAAALSSPPPDPLPGLAAALRGLTHEAARFPQLIIIYDQIPDRRRGRGSQPEYTLTKPSNGPNDRDHLKPASRQRPASSLRSPPRAGTGSANGSRRYPAQPQPAVRRSTASLLISLPFGRRQPQLPLRATPPKPGTRGACHLSSTCSAKCTAVVRPNRASGARGSGSRLPTFPARISPSSSRADAFRPGFFCPSVAPRRARRRAPMQRSVPSTRSPARTACPSSHRPRRHGRPSTTHRLSGGPRTIGAVFRAAVERACRRGFTARYVRMPRR